MTAICVCWSWLSVNELSVLSRFPRAIRAKPDRAEPHEICGNRLAFRMAPRARFELATPGDVTPSRQKIRFSVNGDPREYREQLAKFVAKRGIALEYSDEIAPAHGTSAGGKITLFLGQSPAEEFATLAHEVAHEIMHEQWGALHAMAEGLMLGVRFFASRAQAAVAGGFGKRVRA